MNAHTHPLPTTSSSPHTLLPTNWRPEIDALLAEIYGYTTFRDLELYKDLSQGKERVKVSQGQIVERVVREAEAAWAQRGEQIGPAGQEGTSAPGRQAGNLLLTAPTGSGKSLLFQLPAIYLGRTYGLLTIVVSPLKALIVDQVEALQDMGYDRVGYASSDLSPQEKAEAYRRVATGQTDLFYLSPELLLSYDIRRLAGDRRIGMVVVDEAHTVTTWGREFRVDYWFLGRYLKELKARLGYTFPVFALTATAVWRPGGADDMIFETVRSLQMAPCEIYVGTVRRNNIGFDIRQLKADERETYDKAKTRVIAQRIADLLEGHKTLLYYPFAGTIDLRLKSWVSPLQRSLVASYYGKKDKVQKAAIVQEFREGSKRLIVATKAFGMGIDISDIDRVYHVAPSSTFVDYIQEIGRSARDANIRALSMTDYHERDFYYMNRLHAAGAITQEQLAMILAKLVEVYHMKGERRDVPVSLTDFEYVAKLPRTKSKVEYESELGQLIKTALLWIEEDLTQRFGHPIIEVSPLGLIGEGYMQDKTGDAFAREFRSYISPVNGEEGLYRVQLARLWEERFPELGYKEFKQKLMGGNLLEGSRAVLVGRHEVLLREDAADMRGRLDALLRGLKLLLTDKLRTQKGRFDESELRAVFSEHGMDVRSAKRFIGSLLESRTEEGRSISYISSVKKKDSNELSFTVTRGFDLILARYQKLFQQRIQGHAGSQLTFYCTPFSDLNMLLNLLSMLGSLSFSVEGGGSPAVQIRFCEPEALADLSASGDYRNHILDLNEEVFRDQISLFKAFFGNSRLTDEERWTFIEDYFTGLPVSELVERYA